MISEKLSTESGTVKLKKASVALVLVGIVLIALSTGTAGAVDVTGCTTISSAGSYELQNDIIDSSATTCIDIEASDVTFDGNGFRVDGQDGSDTVGIDVTQGDVGDTTTPEISNITVRNVTVTDWGGTGEGGIVYFTATDGDIINVNATSNDNGIYVVNSEGTTVTDSYAENNPSVGIEIGTDPNYNVTDNTLRSNGNGIEVDGGDSSRVANNDISGSSGSGFAQGGISIEAEDVEVTGNEITATSTNGIVVGDFFSTSNINVSDNVLRDNSGVGILTREDADNTTAINNTIEDNDDSGIRLDGNGDSVLKDNVLRRNGQTNGVSGIDVFTDGNRLVNNTVVDSGDNGVYVDGADNVLREITATENAGDGIEITGSSSNATLTNSTVKKNSNWDLRYLPDVPTTVENLNIGNSTAANTTLDFETRNVELRGTGSPPADPPNDVNIGRYVEATGTTADAYLDVTFEYEDGDVPAETQESDLDVWKNDGSWTELGTDSLDMTANEIRYNVTNVGSFFAPLGFDELNEINRCRTINASNAPDDRLVELGSDIQNSPLASCINVTVSDITLDGQNNVVDGDDSGGVGIKVTNASTTLTNVTVRNVNVTDWDRGVSMVDVMNSDIEEINATSNSGITLTDDGVQLGSVSNINVTRVDLSEDNDVGLNVGSGTDIEVIDSRLNNNERGIFVGTSSSITVRNSTANDNTGDAFDVGAATIINSTAIGNGQVLRAFNPSAETTVRNLDIGDSTAPNTTIDGEFLEAALFDVSSPPSDPNTEQNISRFVDITEEGGSMSPSTSYANITFQYTDSDVSDVDDESRLDVWKNNGSWFELGTGPATDPAANRIQYNITDFGSVFAPLAFDEINNINKCRTINAANAPSDGVVNVTDDITNSAVSSCINITVSDITLAGQNNTIDGVDDAGIGVNVTNSSSPAGEPSNVVVKNLTATNWGTGVEYDDANGGETKDVDATSNGGSGILLDGSPNHIFRNVLAVNNDPDLGVRSGNATLENVDVGSSLLSGTANDVEISETDSPPADPSGEDNIGQYFNATETAADGFFDATVQYTDADVSGVTEATLAMWRNDGSWSKLPSSSVDTANNEVSANITSFSVFAPLANTSGGVSSCVDITQPGQYLLTTNLIDRPESSCVNVTVSDVVFDGGDNAVDSDGTGDAGVKVTNTSTTLTNVTVRNVKVTDWDDGVRYTDADDGKIVDVNSSSNRGVGIFTNGENTTITGSVVRDSGGQSVKVESGADDSTVEDSVLVGNSGGSALDLISNNNTVENVTVANGGDNGVFVFGDDNILRDLKASNNPDRGIEIRSEATNTTVVASTINDNANQGIDIKGDSAGVIDTVLRRNGQGGGVSGIDAVSVGSKILNTTVSGSGDNGVYVTGSDTVVRNSTLRGNDGSGLVLTSASSNTTVVETTSRGNSGSDLRIDDTMDNTIRSLDVGSAVIDLAARNVDVSGVVSPPSDPGNARNIGRYVNATGTSTDSFLDVTFRYTDASGVVETTLAVWEFEDGTWSELPSELDTGAGTVSTNVTNFSVFAPLGNAGCIDRRDVSRGQEEKECPTDREINRGGNRGDLDRGTGRGSDTRRRDRSRGEEP